jgi:hypothetical protein
LILESGSFDRGARDKRSIFAFNADQASWSFTKRRMDITDVINVRIAWL